MSRFFSSAPVSTFTKDRHVAQPPIKNSLNKHRILDTCGRPVICGLGIGRHERDRGGRPQLAIASVD